MNEISFHPIANIFSLMQSNELQQLASDIQENGLKNKIVIYADKILDGRNRYKACQLSGVKPEFEQYDGDNALQYVLSMNLHRRHLNQSQRAVVASRLANMTHGGDRKSDQAANLPLEITQSQSAKMLNVSERLIRTVKAIEKAAPDCITEIESGTSADKVYRSIKKEEKKEEIKRKVKEKAKLPQNVFIPAELILADPPWKYDFAETSNRQIENQYPTATLDEIKNHKPETADDCVLFMWATAPKLKEALDVVDAWGFSYKTHAIWDKVKIGMGYWFRGQHELLLVATKGKVAPPMEDQRVSSIFTEARQGHSRKPECVYQWIEKSFPHLVKIEMYARKARNGWNSTGNEL